MLDRSGVIRNDRENIEGTKAEFATSRKINTLAEAVKDSDVFIGLSSPDVLTAEMLKTMAKKKKLSIKQLKNVKGGKKAAPKK